MTTRPLLLLIHGIAFTILVEVMGQQYIPKIDHRTKANNNTTVITPREIRMKSATTTRTMATTISDSVSVNIVGGTDADPGEFPFFVHPDPTTTWSLCGGTMIHPDVVLTAAHCQDIFRAGNSIRIGTTKRVGRYSPTPPNTESIGIEFGINHFRYDDRTLQNDIRLIKLVQPSQRISLTDLLQMNADDTLPYPGQSVTAIGFGQLSTLGRFPTTLQKVSLITTHPDQCTDIFGMNQQSILCAGSDPTQGNRQDICTGDSGGPLFTGMVQYGIASFGKFRCAIRNGVPSAYTRVSTFFAWINDFICRHSTQPPAHCYCGAGIGGGEICQHRNNGCEQYTCTNLTTCTRVTRTCNCGHGVWNGTICVCDRSKLIPWPKKGWCHDKDGFCTVRAKRRWLPHGKSNQCD